MLSIVVLPPPDGPLIITNSPFFTPGNELELFRFISLSATTLSSLPSKLYSFFTPNISITVSVYFSYIYKLILF